MSGRRTAIHFMLATALMLPPCDKNAHADKYPQSERQEAVIIGLKSKTTPDGLAAYLFGVDARCFQERMKQVRKETPEERGKREKFHNVFNDKQGIPGFGIAAATLDFRSGRESFTVVTNR